MEEKYGEFIGVDNLHIALITADTEVAYTPGAPAALAPVAEIAAKAAINKVATYYDNQAASNYEVEGPTEIKVVVSNLDAEKLATVLGKNYVTADGLVYDSGQADPPKCALGFRYNMGAAGYRYYWYLLGTFSGGEEAAVTKKDNVDVKTYELTFTALPTTHKFPVDGEQKSIKRIFGDTADENFDETGWFTTIPTPSEA